MKSFKVVEKLMRDDAPDQWTLDRDINVKGKVVPAGTIGDVKLGYKYAHSCPCDRALPKISWDSSKRSRLPITPIDHQAIAPTDERTCERCGRSCLKPNESWEELYSRTPWWDKPALIKTRTIKMIGSIQVERRWSRVPFTAYSVLGCGDRELTLCGDCLKKEKAAQKHREASEKQAQESGRKQLALFEV